MEKSAGSNPAEGAGEKGFEVTQPNVAGIDVGSRSMYVCAPGSGGKLEVREFATTTQGIRKCARWLKQGQVESAAAESTGVYWIPVMEVLEAEGIKVLLVDTRPMSRVPGRKTDVKDCEWIAQLLQCGLLRRSFIPPRSQRDRAGGPGSVRQPARRLDRPVHQPAHSRLAFCGRRDRRSLSPIGF